MYTYFKLQSVFNHHVFLFCLGLSRSRNTLGTKCQNRIKKKIFVKLQVFWDAQNFKNFWKPTLVSSTFVFVWPWLMSLKTQQLQVEWFQTLRNVESDFHGFSGMKILSWQNNEINVISLNLLRSMISNQFHYHGVKNKL